MRRTVLRINSLLLACGCAGVCAYVRTSKNPADPQSKGTRCESNCASFVSRSFKLLPSPARAPYDLTLRVFTLFTWLLVAIAQPYRCLWTDPFEFVADVHHQVLRNRVLNWSVLKKTTLSVKGVASVHLYRILLEASMTGTSIACMLRSGTAYAYTPPQCVKARLHSCFRAIIIHSPCHVMRPCFRHGRVWRRYVVVRSACLVLFCTVFK